MGSRWRSLLGLLVSATLLGLLSSSAAYAYSYTTILGPPGAELTQREIMDVIYGGTFVQAGQDYSNGAIDLIRIWDNDDPTSSPGDLPLDLVTGKPLYDIDQI